MWYLYALIVSHLKFRNVSIPGDIPGRWTGTYKSPREFSKKPKDLEAPRTDSPVGFPPTLLAVSPPLPFPGPHAWW